MTSVARRSSPAHHAGAEAYPGPRRAPAASGSDPSRRPQTGFDSKKTRGDAASFAYAYSLAAVESIIQTGGISDISRLLDHIATAQSMEQALRESLHADYPDLDQQTVAYLRHEYLR